MFKLSFKYSLTLYAFIVLLLIAFIPLALSGCGGGGGGGSSSGGGVSPSQTVSGSVLGGTNAISGAAVYLYEVGSSGAATLLGSSTTAADGTFTITLTGTPSTSLVLYIVTSGGTTTGVTGTIQVQLVAFVGNGSSANISGIIVNELSTAAASYVAYKDLGTGGTPNIINYTDTTGLSSVMVLNGGAGVSNVMGDYNNIYNNTDTLLSTTLTTQDLERIYTIANLMLYYIQGGTAAQAALNLDFGTTPTDTFNAYDIINNDFNNSLANFANTFNGIVTPFFFDGETGADMSTVFNGGTYPTTAPPAPANLTATSGDSQAVLSWTASSGATSYNIYESNSAAGTYTEVASSTATTYTVTGLTDGTTYYFEVTAVNSAGESSYSTYASATPAAAVVIPVSPPPAPANLTATSGDSQAVLSWTASSGATSYNIYESNSAAGTYTEVASSTATTYTVTGLTDGTTYYFEVTAVNSAGESSYSTYASATPAAAVVIPVSPPPAPANLTATSGDSQAVLSWTASSGATSYNIYESNSAAGTYTEVASSTATTYTVTGLTDGTTYYFEVTAVNSAGESSYSTYASATPAAVSVSNTMNVYLDKVGDGYSNVPYVNVYINGSTTPIHLDLDTGATGIMINQSALTNIGIALPQTGSKFSGSFGDGGTFYGSISSADVSTSGGLTAQNIPVAVATKDTDFPSAGFIQGDFGMGLSPYASFGMNNGITTVFTPSFATALPPSYNNGFILNFNNMVFTNGYDIIGSPDTTAVGTITYGLNTASDNAIPAGINFYPNTSGQTYDFPMITSKFGGSSSDAAGYQFYSLFDTGTAFIMLGTDAINYSISPSASTNDVIQNGTCAGFLYGGLMVNFSLYDLTSYSPNNFITDPDSSQNSFCDYTQYTNAPLSDAIALDNVIYYYGSLQGQEDFGLPFMFNQPMYWQAQSGSTPWGVGIY